MPLTEAEKQEILARQQARQSSSGLPPAIAEAAGLSPYISGVTRRGVRVAFPKPEAVRGQELEDERRKRQMQAETPIPTEMERERTPMAQSAVSFIDQFAKRLGVNEAAGTVQRPDLLAPPMARELVPQQFQDYVMSEDSSMVYNDLESAFQLGSIVLTGRQGDIGKLQQLRDVYSFGGAVKEKPKLVVQRIRNLRKLFQTFDRAGALEPEQRQQVLNDASQQMDALLGEADPNIATLQKQFPGATIRRKQ